MPCVNEFDNNSNYQKGNQKIKFQHFHQHPVNLIQHKQNTIHWSTPKSFFLFSYTQSTEETWPDQRPVENDPVGGKKKKKKKSPFNWNKDRHTQKKIKKKKKKKFPPFFSMCVVVVREPSPIWLAIIHSVIRSIVVVVYSPTYHFFPLAEPFERESPPPPPFSILRVCVCADQAKRLFNPPPSLLYYSLLFCRMDRSPNLTIEEKKGTHPG